jgi:Transposase, Mutator family
MSFPKEHRAKLHSTNPLERVNGEVKRLLACGYDPETLLAVRYGGEDQDSFKPRSIGELANGC